MVLENGIGSEASQKVRRSVAIVQVVKVQGKVLPVFYEGVGGIWPQEN